MPGNIGGINYLCGALPAYTQMCNPFCNSGLSTYDIDLSSSMYGMPSFCSTTSVPSYYNDTLGDFSNLYYGAPDAYSYSAGIGDGTMPCDSVFGGLGGMPYDSFMGCGMFNDSNYFRQMEDYQKFYNQYNINQQKMQRNADLEVRGPMESIQEASDNLKRKIEENEQGQVMGAYNAFVESIKNAFGESNTENIKGKVQAIYKQINGKKIDEHLKEQGHSSFVQGLLSTMTGGFYYRRSAEDNISEITGQPVGSGDKFMSGLGRTSGAVGFGLITAGITKGIEKLISSKAATEAVEATAKKSKGKYAIIAGIAAAGLSLINSLRD